MTTEEKAKRYDEALERARMLNNGEDVDVETGTTTCEYIFPELKESESEDEKIRKKIVSAISYYRNDGCISEYEFGVCRNWLEKQKEQKPVEWNNTDMKEARDNLISVCRDWVRGEQTTLLPIAAVRARYFLEHLTEPKSAEWSKDDKYKLNFLTGMLEGLDQREFDARYMKELSSWLKSLPERFNLQPKNEWSKEDEHRCCDAIYFLETAKKHYADTSEIELTIEWLKSLQPQAKQEQKEQTTLEYLPKKKIYDIMSKLTSLSFSRLIPINSEEYRKIEEITSDVLGLLDYPIEWQKEVSVEETKVSPVENVQYEPGYFLDGSNEDIES